MNPNNCCNVDNFIKAIADETRQSAPLILREPHPGKQIAYIVRVPFPYHREPICRLKVEIIVDEPILISPESRPILHNDKEAISVAPHRPG
jgi:hypothetical protein